MAKKTIYVDITGPAGSGKSTIGQIILNALGKAKIERSILDDSELESDPLQLKLKAKSISEDSHVCIRACRPNDDGQFVLTHIGGSEVLFGFLESKSVKKLKKP